MGTKKPGKYLTMASGGLTRQWKESGPEQMELNRLFKNDLIEDFEDAKCVRLKSSLFMEFSPRVFAAHFKKTKAKFGKFAHTYDPMEGTSKRISEIEPEYRKIEIPTRSMNFDEIVTHDERNCDYVHPEFATWTYTDHELQCVIVYVAVRPLLGSTDCNFKISEDGMKVSINCNWSSSIIQPQIVFKDEINHPDPKKRISYNHPKIEALSNYWLSQNITPKSKPSGSIVVKLPVQVQREIGSWKKSVVKISDTDKIILLEFKAFQINKVIEDADTTISLE